jgi:D-alanyl-lipoteichoic acid acyltransferase DltB (MBOAT superfamily)
VNILSLLAFTPLKTSFAPLDIIIPLGISFYTFQAISYLINIYRDIESPEKNFLKFYLYVIYFPKLVSGPIEESKRFFPQLENLKVTSSDVKIGTKLILLGLFKKIVIADRLMIMKTAFHQNLDHYTGFPLLFLFLVQPIMLYCDFSGYTDMALGISRLFGIRLTENFERPFFSTSVSMFWRRWHMSLSNWCNNYIFKYIVFVKRKWNNWAAVYGVFITFLIIGIWHGDNWNFIILGILQALAINYEFFTKKYRLKWFRKIPLSINNLISRISVYLFFCVTLVFFFASSLGDALLYFKGCFSLSAFKFTGNQIKIDKYEILAALFAFVVYFGYEYMKERKIPFPVIPSWAKWTLYGVLVIIIVTFGLFATNNFIYAQF